MDNTTSIASLRKLPAQERAAAIAHYIYVTASLQAGWELRVPREWEELPQQAKDFNLKGVETWVRESEAFNIWCEAIKELQTSSPHT